FTLRRSPTSPLFPYTTLFRSGWLYLAVILDLFTRKVVGWAMRDHMRAELTIAALTIAIQQHRPGPGLIHHSDRGSQYAAGDYREDRKSTRLNSSHDQISYAVF